MPAAHEKWPPCHHRRGFHLQGKPPRTYCGSREEGQRGCYPCSGNKGSWLPVELQLQLAQKKKKNCSSLHARLKRAAGRWRPNSSPPSSAAWQKWALVGAATKPWLRAEPNLETPNVLVVSKNQITSFPPPMTWPRLWPRKKKVMVKLIASGSTSSSKEDPYSWNPPCSSINSLPQALVAWGSLSLLTHSHSKNKPLTTVDRQWGNTLT